MLLFFKRIIFILFIASFSNVGFGQKMSISGDVKDTLNATSVQYALAMVVRLKDSVLVGFQRTDANGHFEINNLPIDTVEVIVSHPQFVSQVYYLLGASDNKDFNISPIILPALGHEIKAVTVYAYKDPVYYKGDTLIYNADSFKVKPNAVVEDLLKKLPGIEVAKDGSIKSQGKAIDRVYVDGDEFFGTDPTVATKNLAANGVASVQVYETKNEDAGETGNETIQVMNLKLKDSAKKGYFGRISGGTDFMKFYEGELLTNYFNKDLKVSVFALGSSTPRSNFARQDVNKFGLQDDDQKGFNEDAVFDWRQTDNNVGIPRTLTAGFYFSDKFGEKKNSKLGANYTFKDNRLNTNSEQTSQYFLTDTNYTTDLISNHLSQDQSNALNLHFTQKLDSLTTLEILPKVSLSSITQNNTDQTNFIDADGNLQRSTAVTNNNVGKTTDFSTELRFTRNFMKKGREFKATYKFDDSQSKSDGTLFSAQTYYFSGSTFGDTTNQSKTNRSNDISHEYSLNYIEPLGKKFKLEAKYDGNYNIGSQSKETRNFLNGAYSDLDSLYSNDFNNNRILNRVGLYFSYESKKHRVRLGSMARNVLMNNVNHINGKEIHQNVTKLLPSFSYTYKFSEAHRIYFRYFATSTQPTIAQLQPVLNNTNPNRKTIGNPDLKPSYTHNFNLSYNIYRPLSGHYIFFGTSFTSTNNAFSNSMGYDAFGRTVSQTVNTNGNQTGLLYLGAGIPFLHRKINLRPSVNGNYSKLVSLINTQQNITTNLSASGGLDLEFDFDSVYFHLGNNFTYTDPKSTLNSATNQPYTTQVYSAEFGWTLPFGFGINTDATYTINGHRANGYNIKYFIWNASITKSFLKKENLILSIEANDMLNQNINANRTIQSNVITDNKTKIITRYFLLRLTYKFSNSKVKEKDDDDFF